MSTKTQLQNDLLRQGSESYLDVLTAMEAFRQQVERMCQGAYDRQEVGLRAAMGLDSEECERWDDPNPADREADLGVRRSAQNSGQGSYIYIAWSEAEDGAPEMRIAVCLEVYPKTARDQIFDNIRT